MANGLLSQYQVNPFQKPETMTQDQFNQSMTESYTRPKNPNTGSAGINAQNIVLSYKLK